MQTLSPTISPTISPKISQTNPRVTDAETDFLPAIAQSSVLQTALAGLDASLNDELDRYRHWQENGQTISYLNPFRPRAVSTQSIWTSPSLSEALSPLTPPVEVNSDRRTIQMPVMPPLGTNTTDAIANAELHQYRGLDLDSLDSPSHSGINADLDRAVAYAQSLHGYGDASMGINSPSDAPNIEPTMAQIPAPDDDEILQSFANDYSNNYADNYQDSVNQEYPYPAPPAEKSALRSLMNPVGIISLLLLLCSSAAIGYLMVDPSGVMKLFKPEQKTKAAQTNNDDLGKDINLQNQQKSNDLSFVPFAGDKTQVNVDSLAKNSKAIADPTFVNKNKNSTLTKNSSVFAPNSAFVPSSPLRTVPSMSLPPMSVAPLPPALAPLERSYTPAPMPRNEPVPTRSYSEPAPSRTPSSNSSSTPKPSRNVSVVPTTPTPVPEYVAPRSNTAVKYAAPISSAATTPPAQSSYRVVVENSYAASAQQIERDAYVRPSDGQVQVGSYRDPNVAQQRIEQLRRQGIPARIE
ncbi:SPOR domain-containing protein [Pseudanabaena yagii]|uniref:SPOR domain-containing protein n=1 Tax=Pseudanabaena yagii GIHE-NHR1 TaxID=2722753 RepID=A0ABX1LN86_9CYAN|nr:hypothetical protein [Pseudanabaena yagii]NMF57593.1 hypothetical protein [Pseudanabaena yagii GIHE-NHR1]